MTELPFIWVFTRGESGPLWGTDDGRHRGSRCGDDDAAHHGEHQEPGLRGPGAVRHLQKGGEVA
ncbi:hypothetical protein, partial [Streptomyces aureus]